jgi:hypothetical protein
MVVTSLVDTRIMVGKPGEAASVRDFTLHEHTQAVRPPAEAEQRPFFSEAASFHGLSA